MCRASLLAGREPESVGGATAAPSSLLGAAAPTSSPTLHWMLEINPARACVRELVVCVRIARVCARALCAFACVREAVACVFA